MTDSLDDKQDLQAFVSDTPVAGAAEDRLGRQAFAERLGQAILKYASTATTSSALVVGLLGPWGSGKSSLINMMDEYLTTVYSGVGGSLVLRRFNPWYYPPQDELISRFFIFLSDAIGGPDAAEPLRKTAKLFKKLAELARPLEHLPGATGSVVKTAILGLKATAQVTTDLAQGLETLDAVKAQVAAALSESAQKLVIVIDDLDRLSAAEIRQVFQLVKSVADFPNVVYVLAFDNERVAKALNSDFVDGREYLEKIINVPLRVPEISADRVQNIFLGELLEFFQEEAGRQFPEKRFWDLYSAGPNSVITSLRDTKRFLNSFYFSYGIISGEVDLVDFFGITIIQIFMPDVYKALVEHPDAFIDTHKTIMSGDQDNPTANRARLDDALATIQNKDLALGLLEKLFPKVDSALRGTRYQISDASTRRDQRVSSLEHFPKYFQLALREGAMSRSAFTALLNQIATPEDVRNAIAEMSSPELVRSFLELLLTTRSQDLDERKIESLILGIVKTDDSIFGDDFGFPLRASMHLVTMQALARLFPMMRDDGARFNLANQIIELSDGSLDLSTAFVDFVEQEQTKADRERRYFEHLSGDELNQLIRLQVDKLQSAAANGSLRTSTRLFYVLAKWKQWGGEEQINAFVRDLASTDSGLIRIISAAVQRPTTRYYIADEPIGIDREILSLDIDLQEATERLANLSESQIELYTPEERAAVRAFLRGADYHTSGVEL